MKGTDIQTLLNQYISEGVLTLTVGQNRLDSDRIDALLTSEFNGVLSATPGEGQVGDTSITYPNATLKCGDFVFYRKDEAVPAVLTISTGIDNKLDLRLSATLPTSWTLPGGVTSGGQKFAEAVGQVAASTSFNVTLDTAVHPPQVNLASGTFTASDGIVFTAGYDLDKKTIALSMTAPAEKHVGIDTIAHLFGAPATSNLIPPNLDLDITALSGSYSITDKRAVFECTPHNWGKAQADVVVWRDDTSGWNIFLGVAVPVSLSLTDVPLIGKYLGDLTGGVKLEQIQLELISADLTAAQAATMTTAINTIGIKYPVPPPEGLPKGAALLGVFDADGQKTRLTLRLTGDGTNQDDGTNQGDGNQGDGNQGDGGQRYADRLRIPLAPGISAVAASQDGTQWFSLQKNFGPVSIQKIGIRYRDGDLAALMNASIAPGGLTIAMEGLGTKTPLNTFEPQFTVDAITVALKEGTTGFAGALVGQIDPLNLVGELALTFGQYQLGAIAGYATEKGAPSFFLYGVLNAPLGGPGFIFVNGLAAGFGLNRELVVPDVSGVSQFPLVKWAVNPQAGPSSLSSGSTDSLTKQVAIAMSALASAVSPKPGEDWFAAGIKFTSFKLVDCFALAIIKFGNDLEVDLLGLATVKVPPAPATPTVAEVQLALKATVQPSTGLIAVTGQLTPSSFILSRSCKLTGGFALCIWSAGPHAGDFVLTIGGYSPKFTPPDHYPKVPRLGLAWHISSALTVTGDLYFALTSSAVMVGGGMKAVWHAGPVQAWFSIEADILMNFTPFHYYISASIQLGASVRVKLLFVHVTVSVHVGVGIEIWGPQFSGKTHIDLKLVKFTISFGAADHAPPPHVSWQDFVTLLLPDKGGQGSAFAARTERSARRMLRRQPVARETQPPPAVVQITAGNGLVTTLSDDDGALNWLVDPQTFRVRVNTVIPAKTYQLNGTAELAPTSQQPPTTETTDFGVGPVGVANADFQSTITIRIDSAENSVFRAVKILSNVAKAMWEYRTTDSHGRPQIGDPLDQTTIRDALTGFDLFPYVQAPDHTQKIPLPPLQYTIDPHVQSIVWSLPVVETNDPFDATETVATTIAAPPATANRPALLAAMKRAGLTVGARPVDVATLSAANSNYLLAAPALRYLGEAK
ncbi:MAG: hypothetical protein CMO29_08895 [Tistrella sp.]|nr:hypothetical protein [Tistrella sp.]